MVQEVDMDGRPVSPDVLQAGNVVATVLAESLCKTFPWAVGFFFGNTEPSLELWTVIEGISGFADQESPCGISVSHPRVTRQPWLTCHQLLT